MVPLPFTMWAGEHDGVLAVRFVGRLGSPWADEERRVLLRLSPAAVRLELSELVGIDSSGLAALVAVRQDVVSGGGRFVLRGAGDAVRAAFAAAGLEALADDGQGAEREGEAEAESRIGTAAGSLIAPVTTLPSKGGRDERRSSTRAPKVA